MFDEGSLDRFSRLWLVFDFHLCSGNRITLLSPLALLTVGIICAVWLVVWP